MTTKLGTTNPAILSSGKTYQCSLYGELPHTGLGKLLERLVGLCGETKHLGLARFCEHQIAFVPAVQTPFGPPRNDDILLRLHSNVLDAESNFIHFLDREWTLLHLSPAEPPKAGQKLANHRAIHHTRITGDVIKYIEMLGYKFEFEVVRRGFTFQFGQVRIDIFRLYQIQDQFRVSSAIPVVSNSTTWIVQVTSPILGQEHVVHMSDNLFQFAAHLSG
ncbi:hypothetical protein BATDEDRAFT_90909 [Batrachochytrium dendrobatidis JAM81]|uniref:Mediator of RNA polymerase II transcription subunit 18 n=3 Tax=Batrachochytrium dendrobatidis TaxID=109871 RepID=F4P8P2_BATDJ|nr:uncharacterized protein BATDEDRAFT_90909 [Batrachochytrium dendrobatidis JAM81]EGF78346.1 hypothetical protein BATDEDRAFT_90909 [Batrachochytrium dendrobatidis JAM81]OAJ44476.1 hypothetical protein, variant 1 [Batrachochytrium dendrobatidis JEL423]|eukprot:XP_006681286.1 hypothetical protein BATDEDRAFT_90909 [Batrachochytrium dendrobatidis JAM81]